MKPHPISSFAAQHAKYQALSAQCKHKIALTSCTGRDHRKAWLYDIGPMGAWGVLEDTAKDIFFFEREEDLMLFKLTWAQEEIPSTSTIYSSFSL